MQEYEDLKVLVAEIEADISKAEGGNKAAGTRVRKQMQRIRSDQPSRFSAVVVEISWAYALRAACIG